MNDDCYDPRSIANLLLDEARDCGIEVTNLALQKLLYFAHGIHLNATAKPLISGYFEAWQYGPVHPAVYRAFKDAGSDPITFRAERRDVLTGETTPIPRPSNPLLIRLIRQVLTSYGQLSPGRLVDISHAKGSPWHYIVEKGRTGIAFGLRIPDDVILARFKHHKVTIGVVPNAGEPTQDTPFT